MRFRHASSLLGLFATSCICACGSEGDMPMPIAGSHASMEDAATAADAGDDPTVSTAPAGCPLTAPTQCAQPTPHFTADIAPILKQRCLVCHDGMHGQWALTDYEHVADWFGEIRAQMIACTMPPLDSGLTMPNAERMTILNWIRCNYPK